MNPRPPAEQVDLERYEAKYVVHPSLVPAIREFIRPFCVRDPNAAGEVPEYLLTTLQLDSPDLALYRASREEAVNRFKLRARTYGEDPGARVFLEIKRKISGVVLKSRCLVPPSFFGPQLAAERRTEVPPFRSRHERANFIEFTRLVDLLGARPVLLIRYVRESYFGANDLYARLTFDRQLSYSPVRSWDLHPAGVRWRMLDTALVFNQPWSGVILELKTYRDMPLWMVELTERFNLVRLGFCKYAVAMRLESVFNGVFSAGAENDLYSPVGR